MAVHVAATDTSYSECEEHSIPLGGRLRAPTEVPSMMPARQTREEQLPANAAGSALPRTAAAPHGVVAAWVFTPDGRLVTGGAATLRQTGEDWRATLAKLDRPGMVATLFFAEGLREVSLQLEDGRAARARITSTTFLASAERVCELAGLEPLA